MPFCRTGRRPLHPLSILWILRADIMMPGKKELARRRPGQAVVGHALACPSERSSPILTGWAALLFALAPLALAQTTDLAPVVSRPESRKGEQPIPSR